MHRRFVLQRAHDETGVSGTGIVAEGTHYTNGKVTLAWVSEILSVTIYDSVDELDRIHGHGGKTNIVWLDVDNDDKESN